MLHGYAELPIDSLSIATAVHRISAAVDNIGHNAATVSLADKGFPAFRHMGKEHSGTLAAQQLDSWPAPRKLIQAL